MDQLANQAAKMHYMSGGKLTVPLVLRTTLGATRRSAAQHSQSLQAWVAHVPGLKVVLPVDAVRREGPAQVGDPRRQPRRLHRGQDGLARHGRGARGASTPIPLGVADVKRAGDDVTLVGTSSMVRVCLEAAELLAAEGISAEVVDPRTLSPLDTDALVESAKKTGRAIVVDEGHRSYGVTAELAAVIAEGAFHHLDAPVRRLGAMDVPVPFSPTLEDETVPTAELASPRRRASSAAQD